MSQTTIICDLGGVFIDLCYSSMKQAFEKLAVSDFDERYGGLIRSYIFFEFETGGVSAEAFRGHLREHFNINPLIMDEAIDDAWNAMLVGMSSEDILSLKSLKRHKIRLIVYSNNNPIHTQGLKSLFAKQWQDLEDVFDDIYLSYEFGHRKPNKKSFIELIAKEQCDPLNTYFIDDTLSYILGAQKAGINSLHLVKKQGMTFKRDVINWLKSQIFSQTEGVRPWSEQASDSSIQSIPKQP